METGKIIKMLREQKGLTQQQLAEIVGAKNYTTITKWESGSNFPKGKDIKKLSEYFNVSSDFILGLEEVSAPQITEYPFLPVSISAGAPITVNGITDKDVDRIPIPDIVMGRYAKDKDIFFMRVNGESMNKVLPHNSLIAVKKVGLNSLHDGDVVVYSNSHEYSVKRFYSYKDQLIFRPDSTDLSFTDYVVSNCNQNVKIHGKVVLYIVETD